MGSMEQMEVPGRYGPSASRSVLRTRAPGSVF